MFVKLSVISIKIVFLTINNIDKDSSINNEQNGVSTAYLCWGNWQAVLTTDRYKPV